MAYRNRPPDAEPPPAAGDGVPERRRDRIGSNKRKFFL